jgi:2-polyprenyl-6-methoxyphenol hydroxylase-like FAD-dependent oxidoreductase
LALDQGQGGNQAIEDAGALAILLSELPSLNDVPHRLELVQNIRRDRAGAMQIFSNAAQDESHRIEQDIKTYVHGPVPSKWKPLRMSRFNAELIVSIRKPERVSRLQL